MAYEKKNPLGPIGETVKNNVTWLRLARSMSKKDISDRARKLGRAIPPLGVSRIEEGERRVDADDLVTLALVLNVSPLTLLMPPSAGNKPVKLTDDYEVTARTAWQWAQGHRTAMDWEPGEGVNLAEPGADPAIAPEAYEREREYEQRRADYMAQALPVELRRAAANPLVQLVHQFEGIVTDVVGPGGTREERARWARMALRRVEQIKLSLEEVAEALATEGGTEPRRRGGDANE